MKATIAVLACVVAYANALPPSAVVSLLGGVNPQYQPFRGAPTPYRPNVAPARPAAAVARVSQLDARNANTVKYGNDINPDGSYSYFYETDNGIAAQEQGTPRNFGGNPPVVPDVAQGSFSWTSPEGKTVSITYVADENGYQPQGDALPQPPPVPPQIQRALDYIARNAPRK